RHLTDVNVNKLYQPWRSFASVINKCLTGKSSGIDSFRLSQAQILWGFYHKINASARKKKCDSASSTTPPTPTPTTTIVSAPRLSAAAKGVPDVPSDDLEEELSWNSSDDEEGDE
nr:hypothetical protein [Tanacetum cinerariifolium]